MYIQMITRNKNNRKSQKSCKIKDQKKNNLDLYLPETNNLKL